MGLNRLDTVAANLRASLESEKHEVDTMYRQYLEYCDAHELGFPRYTFSRGRKPKNCPVCGAPADKIRLAPRRESGREA